MHFKHPEILYFLFLLVIPIIVHLFQLRKFKKTYFTNVKLLKELQQQTQKSSTIKKWLLLATRLLLLAFLIFAFAQPFFKAKDNTNTKNELIILLDNSFSMQAKGSNGELLRKSIQDILENIPENQEFSLLTTSDIFWDTNSKAIQSDLQKLKYSSYAFQPQYLISKVDAKKTNITKDFIIISDGIGFTEKELEKFNAETTFLSLSKAENKSNVALSNVAISAVTDNFYEITIGLQQFGNNENEIPLTITENENTIAKTQIKFSNETESVKINIPKKAISGKISIDDGSLPYDNNFYFTIEEPKKQNVLIIGSETKNSFLQRIFKVNEFETTSTTLAQLNFNSIENQQTIILNELEEIPQSLQNTLSVFYKNGGNLVVIPFEKMNVLNLNSALKSWSNISFGSLIKQEKLITKINFNHPLYKNVFEKTISNFQYPKTNSSYAIQGNVYSILQYEDGSNFLASTTNSLGNLYVFNAPINKENSNFQNSPLIVPTIYNMGITNENMSQSTLTISKNESVVLDAILSKDEVLSVGNANYSFIPMQQILNDKVKLSFGDYPEQDGNYSVTQKNNTIAKLSFNYPRTESNLTVQDETNFSTFTKINSVQEAIDSWQQKRTETNLWKWFLATTLLLLIIELLIQKFVK